MSKIGHKGKLDALTDAQREQLIAWLCVERLTYEKALLRVEEQFGMHTSSTALCKFWQRHCEPYLLRRPKLEDTFLEIKVRVRHGDLILGETDFSVALNTAAAKIEKDVLIEQGGHR